MKDISSEPSPQSLHIAQKTSSVVTSTNFHHLDVKVISSQSVCQCIQNVTCMSGEEPKCMAVRT